MRVLFVEDSLHLQKPVVRALKASGYAVDSALDGEEGLWKAQSNDYDVIILDIMLPNLDGLQILARLREGEKETPVLFLTARDAIEDRVKGLQMGADDYLVKPFALEELLARVETLSRRRYEKRSTRLVVGDLEMDTARKAVRRGGRELRLAPKQYALLEYLMLRAGQVISRSEIEEHLYDDLTNPLSNVVDSAMCALRKILQAGGNKRPLLHTKRGHGYILEDRSDEPVADR